MRRLVPGAAQAILIVGRAGGVGSIAIQIARALTNLTVIATASRPEMVPWVKEMGAHYVVNHADPLAAQVTALGIGAPAFMFSTTHTIWHLDEIAELIAPQGQFALIDDSATLNIKVFKRKPVSIHLDLMYIRSIYGTPDIGKQGRLPNEVPRHTDISTLHKTMMQRVPSMSAANLK